MIGTVIKAQDVARNMFVSNGHVVFRVAKVIPLNLVGIVEKTADSVKVVPTYTNVQFVTSRGNVINATIDADFYRI